MKPSRAAWKDISKSFIAGTFFSFPIAWAVCSFALGWLSRPIPNALLGICISFLVYTVAFAWLTKRSVNSVMHGLATKTALEMTLRALIHGSMMYGGFSATWASFAAQLIAGSVGHLSVTAFVEKEAASSLEQQ